MLEIISTNEMEEMDTDSVHEPNIEDGEIDYSDDERVANVNVPEYKNNVGGFTTGFNVFDVKEDEKRLERAKRFALENTSTQTLSKEVLDRLYQSLGVDLDAEKHYRLNAIHMRGTEDMSTEDVFEYFASYAAASIEWINDVSCNVLWLDDISAARAMLSLSKEIHNLEKIQGTGNPFKDIVSEETKDNVVEIKMEYAPNDAVDANDIKCAIPPGLWRFGVPCSKAKNILLRFSTRLDKKQPNAQKNSEYYKKYGNPRFGNLTGIISSSHKAKYMNKYNRKFAIGRRRYSERLDMDKAEKEECDEDLKKNPWGAIAEEWGFMENRKGNNTTSRNAENNVSRMNMGDLRESLTRKVGQKMKQIIKEEFDSRENSDDSDSEHNWIKRSKVPRMKMHADDEEKKTEHLTKLKQIDKLRNETLHQRQNTGVRSHVQKNIINNAGSEIVDLRNLITTKKKKEQIYSLKETSRGVWTRVAVENTHEENSDSDRDESDSESGSSDDSSNSESTNSDSSSSSSTSGDEKDSEDWALEEYKDLRETLQKSKKCRPGFVESKVNARIQIQSGSEESDLDNISLGGHRSPLQIEIDNDEYYKHKK